MAKDVIDQSADAYAKWQQSVEERLTSIADRVTALENAKPAKSDGKASAGLDERVAKLEQMAGLDERVAKLEQMAGV